MKKKSNGTKAVVRAMIPKEVKDEAVAFLDEVGVSQSEVIYMIFKYIAEYREIPLAREEILTKK